MTNRIFSNTIVINNTIEPNFKDSESIKKLNCFTPEQYLEKVMLSGEIETLVRLITKLSGFDTDIETMIDEVKN